MAEFLKIDSNDEKSLIEDWITFAREFFEDYTRRAVLEQTFCLTISSWPSCSSLHPRFFPLDRSPLVSVENVKYWSTEGVLTTMSADDYLVSAGLVPGYIILKSDKSWPSIYDRPDAIQVNFTAGVETVEEVKPRILQCLRLLTAHCYIHRSSIKVGTVMQTVPLTLKYQLDNLKLSGFLTP